MVIRSDCWWFMRTEACNTVFCNIFKPHFYKTQVLVSVCNFGGYVMQLASCNFALLSCGCTYVLVGLFLWSINEKVTYYRKSKIYIRNVKLSLYGLVVQEINYVTAMKGDIWLSVVCVAESSSHNSPIKLMLLVIYFKYLKLFEMLQPTD